MIGFEFEMGIVPQRRTKRGRKGSISRCATSRKTYSIARAVEKGQVVFYDVAYVEVEPKEGPRGDGEAQRFRCLLSAG